MITTIPATAGADLQRRLRRMIDLRGLSRVSAELGIGREQLARYLADLPVTAGTFERIESTLAKLAKPPSERCPTCNSPDPAFYPAMRLEGAVQLCSDPWHAVAGDASRLS